MRKAAWWAVVAVAAAATLAEEQSGGESSLWLPEAPSPSLAWWAALGGDTASLLPGEGGEAESEEEAAAGPWLAKRQPPHSLGSVVDMYRSVASGLYPFTAKPVKAAPQRRSARWPAACKFNHFGFVCWNAGRRGAVMRQRPMQYNQ